MKPIYLAIALLPLIVSTVPNVLGAFGDITLTAPKMVNTSGQELTSFQVGQQIGVESTLTNHASSEQKFTYLVQVIDNTVQPNILKDFLHPWYLIKHLLHHRYGFQKIRGNIRYRCLYGIV